MVAASVFLPSHNKGEYALEAIESVLNQSFTDWELWILENSTEAGTRELIEDSGLLDDGRILYNKLELGSREGYYPTARLLNMFYPAANGDFIFYLSDDDLLEPGCLKFCINAFDKNPEWDVVYFGMMAICVAGPRQRPHSMIGYVGPGGVGPDAVLHSGDANSRLDGGQIAHRKQALATIGWPFFDESMADAYHSDGVFMEKLLDHFNFYPVREPGVIHRYTPLSQWVGYTVGVGREPRW